MIAMHRLLYAKPRTVRKQQGLPGPQNHGRGDEIKKLRFVVDKRTYIVY